MFDIIIKNGTVIDGIGTKMFTADVGVKEGRIAKIGELHDERATKEIDAGGKLVVPGFVDVCNHSDTFWQLFLEPDLKSLAYQGITTIIGGNCGSSLAPLTSPKTIESIQKWADISKVNVNWLSLAEFFDFISQKKLALNFATLTGHATLRRGVLEDQMRSPTPKELSYIKKKLEESLKEGSVGMSTGLIYTHARMATMDELVELAEIVKKYGGVYATHIRDESEGLNDSIEEAVDVAEKSGVKLHVSHFKAVGAKNWSKMEDALALMERMRENGMDISFDIYPYTNTGSVLYTYLPAWVSEGGKKMMLARLSDPVIRAKVVSEMKASVFEFEKIEIASSGIDKHLVRRKIADIARSQGKTVEDAIIDILIASDGRVITSAKLLSEGNIRKALRSPISIVSSNGAGYDANHSKTGEMVHPRSFGTFIKVLEKYVLEEGEITWEEAIAKMSGRPAKKFGLKKRGCLREGFFADIIVLDEDKIAAPADTEDPYRYSRGVEYSLINGKIVLENGRYKNLGAGELLRR